MPKYLPPRCPDCNHPMIFITEDMNSQGGPPADTWLCDHPSHTCGRVLGSYHPSESHPATMDDAR